MLRLERIGHEGIVCFGVLCVLCGTAPVVSAQAKDVARGGPVTFNQQIAPLVREHCSTCHRPGEAAPFNLLTYEDTRSRARQIRDVASRRYMPPWKPAPGYGEFAGARRLSESDIDLIQRWVDQGALEGDPVADREPAPSARDWPLGTPDLVVEMPVPYVLASQGADTFRTFVIPIPATVPSDGNTGPAEGPTRAIHHANLKIDPTRSSRRLDEDDAAAGFDGGSSRNARFPDGQFLGWTPGQTSRTHQDTAWRLPPASDLIVEAHMTPTGKPERIQIAVGFYFTDKPPGRVPYMLRIGSQRIDIPAGAASYVSSDSYVLPVAVDVVSVQPHAHGLAKRIEATAQLPDGAIRWLIKIDDWDFKWQDVYDFATPLSLPAGSVVTMRYTYDNSATNVRNPNVPPKRVTFGQTTSSEMGDLWLQVVTASSSDRAVLDADYAPKMLREDIAGAEKAVEIAPRDARLHADLGLCYFDAGRVTDAIAELQSSVRLDPTSASAHYDLGAVLLNEKLLGEARAQFDAAIRLKPDFSEAHNNLGVIQFLQGRIDEALGSYNEALRAAPDNAEAHYNLGRALAASHDVAGAIAHYRRALEISPDDAETHVSLAGLVATQGQIAEAVWHYRKALETNPDLPAALADLAWILAASDRPDVRSPEEAVRLAERVAKLTRYENATVLDTLAAAYFASGRIGQAIVAAKTALQRATSTGEDELANRIRDRLGVYERESR